MSERSSANEGVSGKKKEKWPYNPGKYEIFQLTKYQSSIFSSLSESNVHSVIESMNKLYFEKKENFLAAYSNLEKLPMFQPSKLAAISKLIPSFFSVDGISAIYKLLIPALLMTVFNFGDLAFMLLLFNSVIPLFLIELTSPEAMYRIPDEIKDLTEIIPFDLKPERLQTTSFTVHISGWTVFYVAANLTVSFLLSNLAKLSLLLNNIESTEVSSVPYISSVLSGATAFLKNEELFSRYCTLFSCYFSAILVYKLFTIVTILVSHNAMKQPKLLPDLKNALPITACDVFESLVALQRGPSSELYKRISEKHKEILTDFIIRNEENLFEAYHEKVKEMLNNQELNSFDFLGSGSMVLAPQSEEQPENSEESHIEESLEDLQAFLSAKSPENSKLSQDAKSPKKLQASQTAKSPEIENVAAT